MTYVQDILMEAKEFIDGVHNGEWSGPPHARDELMEKIERALAWDGDGKLAEAPQKEMTLSESHAQLAKFYGVDSLEALVDMQAHHIEKLQAKLPPTPNPFAPQMVRKA